MAAKKVDAVKAKEAKQKKIAIVGFVLLLLVLGITIATVAGIFSPIGTALARHARLAWLIGFQAFRMPVEWWLHHAYEAGFVPVQMTYAGRNFDVVTGVTALVLGIWIAMRPVPRRVVLAWNVLGLALLINIVVVAILATPVPFRVSRTRSGFTATNVPGAVAVPSR